MNIRQTIVPKKTGGNTIVNYGFSSTTNNSGGNTTINTNNLSVTNLNADTINSNMVTTSQLIAQNANVTNLNSSNITTNDLHVNGNSYLNSAYFNTLTGIGEDPTITTDYLEVQVQALIEYLVSNGGILNGRTLFDELVGKEGGTSSITTDYLTVLKSAHFFELIIDKIRAAGGSLILTPADGFTIEKVVDNGNDYTLFWKATDGEKKRVNMWEAGDQALCQAFNKGVNTAGNYTDVQTKYYWSLVTAAGVWTAGGNEPVEVEYPDGSSEISNYITISKSDIAQGCTLNPEIGDDIVMLGNRNIAQAGKLNRGTAIYIAAYNSIDGGLTAPCFATYSGIDDFDLPSHRVNKIDMNGTVLTGTFTTTGGSVLDGTSFTVIPNASNIIRLTTSGTTSISPSQLGLFFLYDVGNGAVYNSILPQACKVDYTLKRSEHTDVTGTIDTPNIDCNANPININYTDLESITLKLYRNVNGTYELKDTVLMNVTDMSNLTNGINGSFTQYAYKNSSTTPNRPTTSDATYPPSGWYTEVGTPPSGQATYMTQRICSYDNNNKISYGAWSTPIRITGENGQRGEDGKSIEFIYLQCSSSYLNTVLNNLSFDYTQTDRFGTYAYMPDYQPTTYVQNDPGSYFNWTDNPQGVNSTYMYECICVRTTSYSGVYDQYRGNWTTFSSPQIWSKWGEKGQDGDGVEYIFKHFTTEQTWPQTGNNDPANWSASQADDYTGPTGYKWSDDPVGTDSTNKYEYVAQRKKDNGSWQKFGEPSLWAKWSKDGDNGTHIEFRYQNKTTQPTKPSAGTDGTTGGWSGSATTPDFANGEYTWMTQCTVSGTGTYGTWKDAIRITGDNGQKGEDGNRTEFIYKPLNTLVTNWSRRSDNPQSWNSSSGADEWGHYFDDNDYEGPVSADWSDNPRGVQANMMYEYVSTRTKENDTWSSFSEPAVWSKWGEKGEDGDGVKYIFTTNPNTTNTPRTPQFTWATTDTSKTDNGWTWYDDPVSPTENHPVYCSQSFNKSESGWIEWSTPAIWATWAQPGAAGKDGLTRQILPQDGYDIVKVVPSASDDKYQNITGKLDVDLRYQVYEISNGVITKVTDWTKYRLVLHVYTPNHTDLTSGAVWSSDNANTKWNDNGYGIRYINVRNLLTEIFPNDSNKQDYYKLIGDTYYNSYCPVSLVTELQYKPTTNSSWQYAGDKIVHDIALDAKGMFNTTDYALNSVFTGSWHDSQGNTVNGISWLTQDVNGFKTTVQQTYETKTDAQSEYNTLSSNIQQNATNITSTVTELHRDYSTTSVTQSMIDQSASNISLYVNKSSSVNYIEDSDFTALNNWTFGAAPSSIDPDEYMLYAGNEPFIDNNRYTAVEIDMTPSGSADTMLYTRQDLTNEATIKAGAKIYIEFYYRISYMNGYYNGQTVVGADICRKSGSVKYINHLAAYNDGIRYANSSGTALGVNSNDSRAYAQVQPPVDTNWHTFRGEFTVLNDVKLTKLYIRLYGWRAAAKPNNQPTLLIIQPKMIVDTASSMKATGIDITQGKITLQADKVTFCDSSGGNTDKISIDPTNGTLKATNAYVSGEIHMNLGYGSSKQISTLSFNAQGYHTINPTTEMATMYYQPPTSTIDSAKYLTLPNPANYEGLELQFFIATTSGTLGLSNVKIQTEANQLYVREGNAYDINSSTTVENIKRPYKIYSTAGNNTLIYNSLYRFKVIGGKWYHLEGIITGE